MSVENSSEVADLAVLDGVGDPTPEPNPFDYLVSLTDQGKVNFTTNRYSVDIVRIDHHRQPWEILVYVKGQRVLDHIWRYCITRDGLTRTSFRSEYYPLSGREFELNNGLLFPGMSDQDFKDIRMIQTRSVARFIREQSELPQVTRS